jgi:methylenetetrahydrofolate reductase (NADPH)
MNMAGILAARRPTFSLEFFPPKTPSGWERLYRVIRRFEQVQPDFMSVTYGAAGATREQTHELVRRVVEETDVEAVPHLTCVCHRKGEIDSILSRYAALGISGIMALGGDAPEGLEDCRSVFVHAIDLVRHIRAFCASGGHPEPSGFSIGVAGFPEGHPAAPNRVREIEYLKAKIDAGADYICTQLFFDNRDFFDFRERCAIAGINVPILAGVMPVTTRKNFERIPTMAARSRYPAGLIRAIERCADDAEIEKAGTEWAIEQCRGLLAGDVAGIHFYTLNRSRAIRTIWETVDPRTR